MFLNHHCFLYASVSCITYGFLRLSLRKSGEIPDLTFVMRQYYSEDRALAWVSCVVFAWRIPQFCIGQIALAKLGPIPARHTFLTLFGRTAESRVGLIRH